MFITNVLFRLGIVLLVAKVNCQYDAEYRDSSDDDEEEHSRYSDDSGNESDHPDYSKYYSTENKSPLTVPFNGGGSGFVAPIEFQSFFTPGNFGFGSASSKQEVLKPAEESNGFERSGEFRTAFNPDNFPPNFSDKPIVKNSKFATKPHAINSDYDNSEVRDLNRKPKNNKFFNDNVKVKSAKGKQSASYQANRFQNPKKSNSYHASSAHIPQYSTRYTQTPYQKYSFQPSQSISYVSPSPYNPAYTKVAHPTLKYDYQPSEVVPQKISKECTRVEKKLPKDAGGNGRVEREAMQCYICRDPSTGTNYEQCSYSTQPNPSKQSYTAGSVEKYSSVNGDRYRFKRYTKEESRDLPAVEVVDQDPYEYVKSYSGPYNYKSKATDNEGEGDDEKDEYFKPDDYSDEYRFGPEFFTDDGTKEEKSSSEIRSEKLKKDAENCKKVRQGAMTCVVCKNLKTGDNYEQCSYSSEPNEKKYAYVKEKKYNSNDDPSYEEDTDSTQEKPIYEEKGSKQGKGKKKAVRHPRDKGDFEKNSRVVDKRQEKPKNKLVTDDPYDIPAHFIDDVEGKKDEPGSDLDEYHFKVFPKYASRESKTQETRVENPYSDDKEAGETKQNVEEVLADFAKKDRSDCKKVLKNGMTCFLCVDKSGLQNEECVYVSESKPQSSHLAYHKVKEYKTQPAEESESKINTAVVEKKQRRKSSPNKITVSTLSSEVTTTTPRTYTIRSRSPRQYRRKNNVPSTTLEPEVSESRRAQRKKENEPEPTIKTPVEFDVHGNEGAFSSETKPVYSKELGFSLPKFMLDKSEDQLEFEEFEKNG